ncbi:MULTISPECIES: helix-turn-helix domain-containing protein [Metallosphaera]|uniref:Transcriptional regulator, TrmB n=3 Tax=Metallosphaera TaxID=41980 RepID=A4YIR2_METS5|nr:MULTISPECIES: helix-turn-helix domain-containing protein [Metallosphaera]ABP96314.1 transcriptional regulator, TrmB [Metallosphaera sedula DSM 5348]AIM28297.1 transcriptional regulator, TrmB [Metallosphaera sedula]AKV75098.1 TrmB family transcriptional regulator [Metallosphaera sedula]AKV77336.1 TrmB family transcriptional regulator [Metallosphaera sedula]AKV79587.1 TrmB family transcriptional regulator [Metallosphaera sedula]
MITELAERNILLKRFLMVGYGLSEADVEAFIRIIKGSEGRDVDYIASELGISKSRASLILKRLSDAGLVTKQKSTGSKGGRPKYVYRVDRNEVIEKMKIRASELCSDLSSIISGL